MLVSPQPQALRHKPAAYAVQSAGSATFTAAHDRDHNFYENKCASLDLQIDNLIYELYSLTNEEVQIVEGGSPK